MKRITKYFFQGLAIILPAAASIYFIYLIFIKLDSLFEFDIPGLGFLITITGILLVGFIGSNILTKGVVEYVDDIFNHLPFVKIVYNAVKDLIEAFVGEKKKFNKPVLVKLGSETAIEVLGFLTEEDLSEIGIKDKVSVYLPESYNFAGNLIIVPKEKVIPLQIGAKEAMTFIVSGGLSLSSR